MPVRSLFIWIPDEHIDIVTELLHVEIQSLPEPLAGNIGMFVVNESLILNLVNTNPETHLGTSANVGISIVNDAVILSLANTSPENHLGISANILQSTTTTLA